MNAGRHEMLGQGASAVPDRLNPQRIRLRLLQLAAVGAVVATVVLAVRGLGAVRARLTHASLGWLMIAVALELLSVLSYVLIFRSVYCPRMRWRLSFQIATSEQAANALLPISGAGGLALGAWALQRGGMNAEQIGRKTVAFFFLTSLANVSLVIVFAALYSLGALNNDPDPAVIYVFGALALSTVPLVLLLPVLVGRAPVRHTGRHQARRFTVALRLVRRSIVEGVPDAVLLVRRRTPGVLVGSFGTTVFDLVVLGAAYRAVGVSPPIGVLVLGYLIGMLGGNVPLPGGIGGVDVGLIGTLTLFHQPLAATTVAVLTYHGIALWVPGLIGSVSFVRLRAALQRNDRPAAVCMPLADPLDAVGPREPVASLD